MKRRFNLSAVQTALLSAVGGVITACGFLATALLPRHHKAALLPSLAATIVPIIVGFALSFKAESSLKDGIAAERWSSEQIESLRANLGSFLWTALAGTLLVAGFILIVTVRHGAALAWVGIALAQTITRLQMAVKRPRQSQPPIDWRTYSPIQSDHWGNR
jgi:hypothetical protein